MWIFMKERGKKTDFLRLSPMFADSPQIKSWFVKRHSSPFWTLYMYIVNVPRWTNAIYTNYLKLNKKLYLDKTISFFSV